VDGPRPRVVALVTDLMDRSRIGAALPDAEFVRDTAACTGAAVVVVDLARDPDLDVLRTAARGARIVAFGAHVDDDRLAAARAAGADLVVARSRFFHDPAAAVASVMSTPNPDEPITDEPIPDEPNPNESDAPG
jgi:hypothetical protein